MKTSVSYSYPCQVSGVDANLSVCVGAMSLLSEIDEMLSPTILPAITQNSIYKWLEQSLRRLEIGSDRENYSYPGVIFYKFQVPSSGLMNGSRSS
ncbi:hypothetical protein HNY73_015349 [Argiope bruennichi]|uniref:Uncharacterized protein n=1 Tax=Argiope bruennichi TaxID=94029 RepID=A0A8T0EW85_ARGBR|nr:hypothetical protein HNY73_015349 [Argiope bruennichi]